MQRLPYVVTMNPHIKEVYDLYYHAFDTFRKVKEVKTLEDNDKLCELISHNLKGHLTVIPKLAMGILECGGLMSPQDLDNFMNTILRSVGCPFLHDFDDLLTWNSAFLDVSLPSSIFH